jgi:hypothetical protein
MKASVLAENQFQLRGFANDSLYLLHISKSCPGVAGIAFSFIKGA